MQYSPRSLSLHENDPSSVASYNVEIRDTTGESVIDSFSVVATPSGETTVPLPLTPAMVGVLVRFYVQQVGPSGALGDWQMAKDASDNGLFTVHELPDGAETLLVNL